MNGGNDRRWLDWPDRGAGLKGSGPGCRSHRTSFCIVDTPGAPVKVDRRRLTGRRGAKMPADTVPSFRGRDRATRRLPARGERGRCPVPKVFISHSSLDRKFVEREIVDLLEGN